MECAHIDDIACLVVRDDERVAAVPGSQQLTLELREIGVVAAEQVPRVRRRELDIERTALAGTNGHDAGHVWDQEPRYGGGRWVDLEIHGHALYSQPVENLRKAGGPRVVRIQTYASAIFELHLTSADRVHSRYSMR